MECSRLEWRRRAVMCDQDIRGARVGGESDRWPIDSEDAMVGQLVRIGIGMVVGIGIGIGIGIGS